MSKQEISVFLVEPGAGDPRKRIKAAHRLGVEAMKETPGRMAVLEAGE